MKKLDTTSLMIIIHYLNNYQTLQQIPFINKKLQDVLLSFKVNPEINQHAWSFRRQRRSYAKRITHFLDASKKFNRKNVFQRLFPSIFFYIILNLLNLYLFIEYSTLHLF